jgi:predicted lipoprotein with Yx(FWY)xxD motif
MRRYWLFLMVGLLATGLVVGAVACSKKKTTTVNPTATTASASETGTPLAVTTPVTTETPSAEAYTVTITGGILTDADGMTLYTFDNDTSTVSACGTACTPTWPPLTTTGTPTKDESLTGTVGTITRDDGSTQVTYNGKPLYHNVGDTAAGDTTGDAVGGVWHVVTP